MRKLICAAIVAFAAFFAMPAFADNGCTAVKAEIMAAGNEVGIFLGGLLSQQQKESVGEIIAEITASPEVMDAPAQAVYDAVVAVLAIEGQMKDLWHKAASIYLGMGGFCAYTPLRDELVQTLDALKSQTLRDEMTAAIANLLQAVEVYNAR